MAEPIGFDPPIMNPATPRPDKPAVPFPSSIAIAGAWGYIGRKFLEVALARGLRIYVHDPGPTPSDITQERLILVPSEDEFYALQADLFHLALHPEHRRLDRLLARAEPLLILNEKPMAQPDRPEECARTVAASEASRAVVLYDFPELFDPLTARLINELARFRELRIEEILVQRSKDREDPSIARNFKRMVPIQYQETVHCWAFILYLLGAVEGCLDGVLARGCQVMGESDPYSPPNPEIYEGPVDGRCRFQARFGETQIEGLTDFKAGATWAKRRVVRGTGDGRPFEVDVSYLEGQKWLRFNGVDMPCDPTASSYEAVIATAFRWSKVFSGSTLMTGLFPNPRFARLTFQLSAALWRSCRERSVIRLQSAEAIESWDAGPHGGLLRSPESA